MYRSLLPFILASLGFILVALTINMSLFEWQIGEIVTDLPREVAFKPTPWTTKIGESLDDDSYIQVYVSKGELPCRPERLNSVVRRLRNDEVVERIALNVNQNIIPWLSEQNKFGVLLFLCGIYIWWFTIWYKRPISEAVIFTVIALILLAVLINIWRFFFHQIGSLICLELRGTVTFNATLSKIHYETLLVLFAAILAEVGALGMMLRQIIRAVMERKRAPN